VRVFDFSAVGSTTIRQESLTGLERLTAVTALLHRIRRVDEGRWTSFG
jgi:hypothetical protein